MTKIRKFVTAAGLAVAIGAFGFAPVGFAQTQNNDSQSGPGSGKARPDAPVQQHMGGGTVPGAGTHGHSSSPKAGETKEIQDQQHNMPATPSHSSGSTK